MSNRGGKRERSGRKLGSPNASTATIRALASEQANSAIAMLVELMSNNDTPAAACISAAKELLERGYGKSGSHAALELETPLSELTSKDAIGIISDKAAIGTISMEDGHRLIVMVEARIKAVELAEVEARLLALENNRGKGCNDERSGTNI